MLLKQWMPSVLEWDATPQLQRAALATVTGTAVEDLDVLKALARVHRLADDVRDVLQASPIVWVREALWSRADGTAGHVRAALASEDDPGVVLTMFKTTAGDALADGLADQPVTPALASAVTVSRRWDLPARIVKPALTVQARAGWVDYASLRDRLYNLDFLVEDEQVGVPGRLAACTSRGTPLAVVEKHIEPLLAAATALTHDPDKDAVFNALLELRHRAPHSEVIRAAYRRYRDRLPVDTVLLGASWQMASDNAQRAVCDVSGAQTAGDLLALWEQCPAEQREQTAADILDREDCPLSLYDRIVADGYDASNVRARGQLWSLQQEGLFKEFARRETGTAVYGLTVIRDDAAASVPQRASWLTDVLLEDGAKDALPKMTWRKLWRQLLAVPGYPRERFADLPAEVISVAVKDRDSAWVAMEVARLIQALPEGTEAETVRVIDAALTPDSTIPPVVAAAATALHGHD